MKVLQIVKTNIGAKWAYEQTQWLSNNGVEVITVLPSIEGGMAEKYRSSGLKIVKGDFSLPITRPLSLFRKIKEINNLVKGVKPDIIHCHFVTNVMMIRLALRNNDIPRLFQVPGPLHLESRLFKWAEITLSNNKDYWAGACKKTCQIYSDYGLSNDKIYLAYYGGYGGKSSQEYKSNTNKLHEKFNIPSNKILVGMVSYFYRPKRHLLQTRGLKGHEDFIDAVAIVRKRNPDVMGIIIGGPWEKADKYFEKVKRYALQKCNDGIIFTGFRNDIKEIYKELDIAVHPSHSENLGGAAESLAAGVPTISTNVGGFPDIVINGETGYTVDPKKPIELSDAIERMVQSRSNSQKMANNGRGLVANLLDIENTGNNILNIYKDIVENKLGD